VKKLVPLIAIFALAACGQMGNKNSTPAESAPAYTVPTDWQTFTHDNFTIHSPTTWKVNQNQTGPVFFIYAPVDYDYQYFVQNINLVTESIKGRGIDLDKYSESSAKLLKSYLSNLSTVNSKKMKDANGEYQQVVYSGDKDTFHLIFEQQYRIVNDEAYVLTYMSLKQQWQKDHQTGENIMSTFSVK